MLSSRKFALLLIIVLLLAPISSTPLQAAYQSSLPVASPTQEITTVRVGVVPVMIYAPLFIADTRGYFADENIFIKTERVAGGSEPLLPLATGDLDVVFGGAGAGLFNYAQRNIELDDDPGFRIVAGVHSESEPLTSPLVVSRERFENGEITSVTDLEGGRVAINAVGAATEYWMNQALVQGGVDPSTVEILAIPFPDVPVALNSSSGDRVDAAILGEPLVSLAEQDGLVVRLADDFIDGFQATFLYMRTDFIRDNREAAVGFVRAYVRASRDLAVDDAWASDSTARVLENYTGVPADINKNAARPYYPVNGTIDVEDLATLQNYFLEREALSYNEPLDIEVMLDTSLLDEVLQDIGEVDEIQVTGEVPAMDDSDSSES